MYNGTQTTLPLCKLIARWQNEKAIVKKLIDLQLQEWHDDRIGSCSADDFDFFYRVPIIEDSFKWANLQCKPWRSCLCGRHKILWRVETGRRSTCPIGRLQGLHTGNGIRSISNNIITSGKKQFNIYIYFIFYFQKFGQRTL